MKSISTLALIGLLFFACKLCSFTGNKNTPPPAPSPTPRPMLYAADLIKQRLGSFTLVKHTTREEMRKTASGFGVQLLDQSNDAGVGEYRSDSGKTVLLSVYSFSSQQTASTLIDDLEREARAPKSRTVIIKSSQTSNGKRLEALGLVGRKLQGMIVWNNGYWFFMTMSESLSEARTLADAVGY
ncbi:MAG TPA: hypothetical protein VGQ72_07395 [Pyrinomonadaceae bacterium]|nr:hypothetical protein [Pyrinomonadaceae bacterium]